MDLLTSVLLVLSTFLFCIVCRYSRRYMMGDPGQTRFMIWLCLTASSVFALVLSQNLLLFALAWCAISLSLHQLLQFYRDRPGAVSAARKKFLISRLGDSAVLAALVLTYRELGTWDFQGMFLATERLRTAGLGTLPPSVSWICGCLVFAALLKSAQFPFHSWLPDTMETPTPVSALMHAGIINAGGILIIRLSPLIALSDFALLVLCMAGGFTALFASIVMQTQASVKRYLAFSTVAQMGFMMLECGLGAFHLALLHMVAHSLFKAHAFLSSGSVVLDRAERQESVSLAMLSGNARKTEPAPATMQILCSIVAAFAICFSAGAALGVDALDQLALSSIFSLALAQMLWILWGNISPIWRVPVALAAGAILSLVYFGLHRLAELVVRPSHSNGNWAGLTISVLFLLIAVAQARLPLLAGTSFGRQLYVHARNGFYCNTLANRVTTAFWPARIAQEEI